MKCKNCGTELPEQAKFCYECGSEVLKEECQKNRTIVVDDVEIDLPDDMEYEIDIPESDGDEYSVFESLFNNYDINTEEKIKKEKEKYLSEHPEIVWHNFEANGNDFAIVKCNEKYKAQQCFFSSFSNMFGCSVNDCESFHIYSDSFNGKKYERLVIWFERVFYLIDLESGNVIMSKALWGTRLEYRIHAFYCEWIEGSEYDESKNAAIVNLISGKILHEKDIQTMEWTYFLKDGKILIRSWKDKDAKWTMRLYLDDCISKISTISKEMAKNELDIMSLLKKEPLKWKEKGYIELSKNAFDEVPCERYIKCSEFKKKVLESAHYDLKQTVLEYLFMMGGKVLKRLDENVLYMQMNLEPSSMYSILMNCSRVYFILDLDKLREQWNPVYHKNDFLENIYNFDTTIRYLSKKRGCIVSWDSDCFSWVSKNNDGKIYCVKYRSGNCYDSRLSIKDIDTHETVELNVNVESIEYKTGEKRVLIVGEDEETRQKYLYLFSMEGDLLLSQKGDLTHTGFYPHFREIDVNVNGGWLTGMYDEMTGKELIPLCKCAFIIIWEKKDEILLGVAWRENELDYDVDRIDYYAYRGKEGVHRIQYIPGVHPVYPMDDRALARLGYKDARFHVGSYRKLIDLQITE